MLFALLSHKARCFVARMFRGEKALLQACKGSAFQQSCLPHPSRTRMAFRVKVL